ncbi:hypothetical protein [Actinomyces faecalis]|uniref:hypothetical protein n=1 Tax=Actinomyces faecalis TaxID=2722820 RepID=UPI001551790E|nr:hypothetical protein [Actinomyces faecalis]
MTEAEGKVSDDAVRTAAADKAASLKAAVESAADLDETDRAALTDSTKTITDATSAAEEARAALAQARSS